MKASPVWYAAWDTQAVNQHPCPLHARWNAWRVEPGDFTMHSGHSQLHMHAQKLHAEQSEAAKLRVNDRGWIAQSRSWFPGTVMNGR